MKKVLLLLAILLMFVSCVTNSKTTTATEPTIVEAQVEKEIVSTEEVALEEEIVLSEEIVSESSIEIIVEETQEEKTITEEPVIEIEEPIVEITQEESAQDVIFTPIVDNNEKAIENESSFDENEFVTSETVETIEEEAVTTVEEEPIISEEEPTIIEEPIVEQVEVKTEVQQSSEQTTAVVDNQVVEAPQVTFEEKTEVVTTIEQSEVLPVRTSYFEGFKDMTFKEKIVTIGQFALKEKLFSLGVLTCLVGLIYLIVALIKSSINSSNKKIETEPEEGPSNDTEDVNLTSEDDEFLKSLLGEN